MHPKVASFSFTGVYSLPFWKSTILLSVLVVLISALLGWLWADTLQYEFNLYHSKSLPYPPQNFVGREKELADVLQRVDFTNLDDRIISIVGPPGFGKSALALHTGHRMVAKGVVVNYVDMVEVSSMQALAEKIFDNDPNIVIRNVTVHRLYRWARERHHRTLLILDNCDDVLHAQKDELQKVMKTLLEHSLNLKILMTSRQWTTQLSQFQLYPLQQLTMEASCALLENTAAHLNPIECQSISNLTGYVPLALKVVGALLKLPNSPDPATIIDNLEQHPLMALSPEQLPVDERVNVSISLSYHLLSQKLKNVGRYLANFPGSFDESAVCGIFSSTACSDISQWMRELTQRSLLEYGSRTERYHFHRLIRAFFLDVQGSMREERYHRFSVHFQTYYAQRLKVITQVFTTHHVQALAMFDTERHNIQHMLVLLGTFPTYEVIEGVEIAFQTKLIECRFSAEELYGPVTNIVKHLQKSLSSRCEYRMFVNFLVRQAVFDSDSHGSLIAAEKMSSYERIIVSRKAETDMYVSFYLQLSHLYSTLGMNEKVKYCHERLLKATQYLSPCSPGSCDYVNIGDAYYFMKKYDETIYFYELALKSQHNIELFYKVYVMINLYTAYHATGNELKRNETAEKVLNMFSFMMDTPPAEFYKHESWIRQIIVFYRSRGELDEANSLEEKQIYILRDIGKKPTISTVLEAKSLAEYKYEDGDYEKAADMAVFAFESLEQLHDEDYRGLPKSFRNRMKVELLYQIGKSKYQSGNYSEGLDYFEHLMDFIYEQNATDTFQNKLSDACMYVIWHGRFKCLVNYIIQEIMDIIGWLITYPIDLDVDSLFPEPPDRPEPSEHITKLSKSKVLVVHETASVSSWSSSLVNSWSQALLTSIVTYLESVADTILATKYGRMSARFILNLLVFLLNLIVVFLKLCMLVLLVYILCIFICVAVICVSGTLVAILYISSSFYSCFSSYLPWRFGVLLFLVALILNYW